ncbi:hypothetical protein WISP_24535 [Willisornis vidua]|uniref:Uncharacterized protein n=1 Tax=Willisornis vidua TaxID=1566151 RepID=A0ABQ9DRL5_9PASS|nr:hypothetical protein WISP_24535 [Willisornis vidua]
MPIDKQQALVRKSSAVNIENFKRQYARRRWKVGQEPLVLLRVAPEPQGVTGRDGAGVGNCTGQRVKELCLAVSTGDVANLSFCPLSLQLSYRIVSLCNHLSRSLVRKVLLRDEGSVGALLKWGGERASCDGQ